MERATPRASMRVELEDSVDLATSRRRTILADFSDEALGSSSVGTWEWDIPLDIVRGCKVTAGLFGLPDRDVLAGLPVRAFQDRIHPADIPHYSRLIERSCRTGGLFISEYRVLGRGMIDRWVLARGTFVLNPDGLPLRSRGILIDITEAKQDDGTRGFFVSQAGPPATPVDLVADHLLEAFELAQSIAEAGARTRLEEAIKLALLEAGKQIATGLKDAEADQAEGPSALH